MKKGNYNEATNRFGLVVAGPTGAGISSFCNRFQPENGWYVVGELNPNGFQDEADPVTAGLTYDLQFAIMQARAQAARNAAAEVVDR